MSDDEGARQGRRAAAAMTVVAGIGCCFIPFSIVTIPIGIMLMVDGVRRWKKNDGGGRASHIDSTSQIDGTQLSAAEDGASGAQRADQSNGRSPAQYMDLKTFKRASLEALKGHVQILTERDVIQGAGMTVIQPQAITMIKNECGMECLQEKMTPDMIALLALYRTAARELASGHHHVYRGVLGIRGMGLLKITDYSLSELGKIGWLSPEQKADWVSQRDRDIQDAG